MMMMTMMMLKWGEGDGEEARVEGVLVAEGPEEVEEVDEELVISEPSNFKPLGILRLRSLKTSFARPWGNILPFVSSLYSE